MRDARTGHDWVGSRCLDCGLAKSAYNVSHRCAGREQHVPTAAGDWATLATPPIYTSFDTIQSFDSAPAVDTSPSIDTSFDSGFSGGDSGGGGGGADF